MSNCRAMCLRLPGARRETFDDLGEIAVLALMEFEWADARLFAVNARSEIIVRPTDQ
jgi:hypothetical protein